MWAFWRPVKSLDEAWQKMFVSDARLAQLVERKTLNLVVVGSSPTVGVILRPGPLLSRLLGDVWRLAGLDSVIGLVVRISAFHADGPGSIPG